MKGLEQNLYMSQVIEKYPKLLVNAIEILCIFDDDKKSVPSNMKLKIAYQNDKN